MYDIIIPTYNESKNISILIKFIDKCFQEHNESYKIIIVDDNSPDKTYEVVNSLKSQYPIILVNETGKKGLTNAYRKGFEKSDSEFVIIMDGDLSHNPHHIFDFINEQKNGDFDMVYGSRYENGGVHGWNLKRKMVSRGANLFAQFFLGVEQSDLTGSFRLYKRAVLECALKEVKTSGYAVQMELAVLASRMRFKTKGVGIFFFDRMYGKSKFGIKEMIMFMKSVFFLLVRNKEKIE